MAVLCLLAGGGSDEVAATIPVPADGGLIGRAEHAAMQVLEPSISREHAKLTRTPMGWLLQALEGANPVRVGGELLGELNLESGDVITLGEVRLRFENKDPNVKSTVVLGDWQPPSAVRRRLETPPSAFESGQIEPDDAALLPPEGHVPGRTTHRPKRIMPGPKKVGGFSPVDTGLHAPTGLGAAPPVQSDFNREVGPRADEVMRDGAASSAAERARASRKRENLQYAGWIVAALLLVAVVALLVRG